MNKGFIRPISAQNKEYGLKDQPADEFDELFANSNQEAGVDKKSSVASSGEK